jgi:KUP system potassium uptake protein
MTQVVRQPTSVLTLAAIGVVYGDIGTSPLYAIKECFHPSHGMPLDDLHVRGVLSLIVWSIVLVVSIKYMIFMMRADNRGEGGSLALLTLATRATHNTRLASLIGVLGIFAAALFYGDSMLTPAVSVLSAVEGLQLLAPELSRYIIPLTLGILTGLFLIQRHGTASLGKWFGPIMSLWFISLAILGAYHIAQRPDVLLALNPWYAYVLFLKSPVIGFITLGSVVLVLTGAETVYADMGHFGKKPIRIAWVGLVMPSLVLNYFGQGALVLNNPATVTSPLYNMVPQWGVLPLIVLATAAAIIASQAVIAGAFSVTRQAFQLKLLPRLAMLHTSESEEGQIYIPFINWILFISVVLLVLGFRSSSNLAAAYGVAVTGTMLIDSLLLVIVMLLVWRWNIYLAGALSCLFVFVDVSFFAANSLKIMHGGWFPLAIGLVIFTLLTTWSKGRQQLVKSLRDESLPLELFLQSVPEINRVEGNAVFLTSNVEGTPPALLHNLKHNKVIHQKVILLTAHTRDQPFVRHDERLSFEDLGQGFYRIELDFGYLDDQNVPDELHRCERKGLILDPMQTSYFMSRETLLPSKKPGMWLWREYLFAWMVRNAATPMKTFHLPPNRVVELGQQITI